MERDESPEPNLDQRQLDDLAALRAAADRRRGLVPGTAAHKAALEEERSIAKRIRAWASRPTTPADRERSDASTPPAPREDPSGPMSAGGAATGRDTIDEG